MFYSGSFKSMKESWEKIKGSLALFAAISSTSLSPTIIVFFKSPPTISTTSVKCLGSGLLNSKVSEDYKSKKSNKFNFFNRSFANLSCLLVQTAMEIFFNFAQFKNSSKPSIGLLSFAIFLL